ncbi:MAG: LysR family transcriptional regulator [Tepidiformaceae bacterium]
MRIEALKSFVTLVRAGSYAATADELFMSSTTIHGQIRALEQELGTTLLTFRGRDLHLTGAGSRLLLFAEQTLEARKKLDDDISGVRRRSPAKLRIAALHGPSIHVLPTAIRAYHQLKNDIVVAVTTSNIGSGLASLSSGQADVAILNDLHTDEIPGGFAVTTVYEDTLAMIIRTEDYEPPDINLLSKYPVATQSPTSAYRKYLEQWARTVGVPIEGAFEHSSFDGVLSYVLQGKCIGMVAGYIARDPELSERIRALNLPDFYMKRKVIAAHAIRPDPLVADFLQFLREFYLPSSDSQPGDLRKLADSKFS